MSNALAPAPHPPIAAGSFGPWLTQARGALRGEEGTEVPCGDCVGCCTSSYFIPVRPEDADVRAQVPAQFLVEAAGMPAGHSLIGYLADGSCPMLAAGKCSIYRQRPQTCRDYDCRIFAAAGIDAGGPDKAVINRRVREWQFTYASTVERQAHDAVRAAAAFIQHKQTSFPGRAPTAPTGIAVLAIKVYEVFLEPDIAAKSDEEIARAIIRNSREFDSALSTR